MSLPLFKLSDTNEVVKKDLDETLQETFTEEIIIGLCGPIGTDLKTVVSVLRTVVQEKFGYRPVVIKLSSFIRTFAGVDVTGKSKYQQLEDLIEGGNKLRLKGAKILAELAIREIAVERQTLKDKDGDQDFKSNRICYIIDSIKNNQELELFRLVYSNLFYFIGVFSNLQIREKNLEAKGILRSDVYKLIDRDSGEEIINGQKVIDTFNQADFFLRLEQSTSSIIEHKLLRYLNLIFSTEVVTPTKHETAMYQAFAAAGNSACLSRQVGASITNEAGEIVSVGWNDVPKVGGSVYKYDEENDALGKNDFRCINLEGGVCFNDNEKTSIRESLVDVFIENGVIAPDNREDAVRIIKNSRIKELIEFSRAVHAEMHSIILAGQNGGRHLLKGKLYCTTYPCHNCARHIVAAGISEVYYIEPYRKSLATKLHKDSISENESEADKVRILLFDGVSPRRYLDFFKMLPNSRKENGIKRSFDKRTVFPKKSITLSAIPILEKRIIEDLDAKELR